jgi:hypothetical protein
VGKSGDAIGHYPRVTMVDGFSGHREPVAVTAGAI